MISLYIIYVCIGWAVEYSTYEQVYAQIMSISQEKELIILFMCFYLFSFIYHQHTTGPYKKDAFSDRPP